ncbi:hypothetical protein IMX26_05605 [Clostridium sp. 'deep sea']|uniref:hypothetical protein n=1 Tax=Clostridium sp. 'deep sea' TaxID=2779445 RepID=UPI0018968D37|nr:hypothetical protein [Clostridium sp. 'deep sea']QOR36289.1 hypothetical protein IMX26_05605 [Clostridium sp. 'deep sea']
MKFKKIVLIILCFIFIIFLLINKPIYNITSKYISEDQNHKNCLRIENLNEAIKSNAQLALNYAGYLIDDKGILHVYMVGENNCQQLKKILDNEQIKCYSVKFTYKQLQNTLYTLSNNLTRYNIKKAQLNIAKNTVEVYLAINNKQVKEDILKLLTDSAVTFYNAKGY